MATPNLIVGYESALDYWRAVRAADIEPDLDPTSGKVIGAMPLALAQCAARGIAACCTEPPLQIVVPDKHHRHNCPAIENRVFKGPLRSRQLTSIGSDISICNAEPLFCQLGVCTPLIDLALIGFELCGSYGVLSNGDDTVAYGLQPLTTIADLKNYAEGAKALDIKGSGKALQALSLATDGSASPRESEIGTFLSLSRARGGAGLGGFVMNRSIKVPPEMSVIVGSKTLKPDFLWEQPKLVLEYDSDEFHLDATQKSRDEARRRVFENLGYTVKCLTSDILVDNAKLNAFISELESVVSPRRRTPSDAMLKTRAATRERLFGKERVFPR